MKNTFDGNYPGTSPVGERRDNAAATIQSIEEFERKAREAAAKAIHEMAKQWLGADNAEECDLTALEEYLSDGLSDYTYKLTERMRDVQEGWA